MPTRIFYGWWMVLVTAIALTAGPILVTGTFGIFIKPLAETFGWSRSAISLGFSIVASFASFAAPAVGLFAGRFGPRKVILCAALLFGSGFLSFVFLSASIWHFYGLYLFPRSAGSGSRPSLMRQRSLTGSYGSGDWPWASWALGCSSEVCSRRRW